MWSSPEGSLSIDGERVLCKPMGYEDADVVVIEMFRWCVTVVGEIPTGYGWNPNAAPGIMDWIGDRGVLVCRSVAGMAVSLSLLFLACRRRLSVNQTSPPPKAKKTRTPAIAIPAMAPPDSLTALEIRDFSTKEKEACIL